MFKLFKFVVLLSTSLLIVGCVEDEAETDYYGSPAPIVNVRYRDHSHRNSGYYSENSGYRINRSDNNYSSQSTYPAPAPTSSSGFYSTPSGQSSYSAPSNNSYNGGSIPSSGQSSYPAPSSDSGYHSNSSVPSGQSGYQPQPTVPVINNPPSIPSAPVINNNPPAQNPPVTNRARFSLHRRDNGTSSPSSSGFSSTPSVPVAPQG